MGREEIMRKIAEKRASCAGKSVDELLVLANGKEIAFLQSLEMAIQQKSERMGDDDLSEEEIIVLAIEALEREVNNGGYSQFFTNLSRQYTPIIVHALFRVGCPETAEITKTAIVAARLQGLSADELSKALETYREEYFRKNQHSIITPEVSDIKGFISNMMKKNLNQVNGPDNDESEKKLDECDQKYYKSSENIGGKLIEFVKANKDKIQP